MSAAAVEAVAAVRPVDAAVLPKTFATARQRIEVQIIVGVESAWQQEMCAKCVAVPQRVYLPRLLATMTSFYPNM